MEYVKLCYIIEIIRTTLVKGTFYRYISQILLYKQKILNKNNILINDAYIEDNKLVLLKCVYKKRKAIGTMGSTRKEEDILKCSVCKNVLHFFCTGYSVHFFLNVE